MLYTDITSPCNCFGKQQALSIDITELKEIILNNNVNNAFVAGILNLNVLDLLNSARLSRSDMT